MERCFVFLREHDGMYPPALAWKARETVRPSPDTQASTVHAKKGRTIMTSQALQQAIKAHEDFVAAYPEQFRLSLPLWRLLASGKPVSREELANSSNRPLEEVEAFLQTSDVRVDQEGSIVGMGLSFQPTRHHFHLDEKTLYTWCALDTLAFPALLGRTVRVSSTCPVTEQEIRLTVTPEGILDLSPAGAVVSVHLPGEETDLCHVQEDICNDGFFFVSREVASAWPSLHPKAVLLSVEEAAQVGLVMARAIRSLAGSQEPERHDQYSI
jgi:alkylmercury lyase